MNEWPLILIAIFIIAIILGILSVLLVWKKKREGTYKEPNYHAFFLLGIVLTLTGLGALVISSLQMEYSFMIVFPIFFIGIVYLTIGLTHRDAWKKN